MLYMIDLNTSVRSEFIDITRRIENVIAKSRVSTGICRVFIPHTTAGLTINENADRAVKEDIIRTLDKLIPESGDYTHSEGNSDAHIKSSLLGNEKTLFIENGRLKLGTWQGVFFCEFDGPRSRNVWLQISDTDIAVEPKN
ncbi:MAG: secondary thiamine-phosphate synthase enzyme YjbQ [Candidatus Omnitrophica bacterium]|nr:secondary thiamine-phosphate synthase enzyme YjbQ [Candidatus Omnitrophota bacterium]